MRPSANPDRCWHTRSRQRLPIAEIPAPAQRELRGAEQLARRYGQPASQISQAFSHCPGNIATESQHQTGSEETRGRQVPAFYFWDRIWRLACNHALLEDAQWTDHSIPL